MTTNGTKRRKLAHDASDDEAQSRKAQKDFFKQAANWDLEDSYETRRRKSKKASKESTKLPIKTADGRLEVLRELEKEEDLVSVESDTEWLEGREDDIESELEEVEEEAPTVSEAQQIREAQEELAKAATALNENPEEHVGSLKTLATIGESKIPAIQMLALMTQMSVYKDIIPGYRIRPQTEDGPTEKVSKEVRTMRQYEQALVSGYQNYVKELARCAKDQTPAMRGGQSVSGIAITCACTLIAAVPHFNFRSELLRILVNKLSRKKIDNNSVKCLQALETLFREDEDGKPTMEAVSLLSKMMKARDYEVNESVLNLFLSLRLLSEFAGKASQDTVERPEAAKVKKGKREFRTKRMRKAMKEQKSLEKDMAAADALVDHEEREKMQSETLKLVFATYFRILKMRAPHLMGAVLEGLAKYAHLINQDFFGDLLEALKDLIRHADDDVDADLAAEHEDDDSVSMRNLTREALLCTVTAFALLEGQDAHNSRNTLHLDLTFFTTHLFTSLLNLSIHPDLELTKMTNSTSSVSKINVQTTTVLLLRSLTAILLPAWNIRSVPPLKLAAFSKQLMTAALQLPDKSCQATLGLLNDVANTHGKKIASLWNTEERKGDGRHNALSDTVEGSNPFAATVWEGELLKKHFSPKVREGLKLFEKSLPTSS
ncbi:nucleolar complex-associated protein domain-containing protein [Trichoderma breve]|uniref:Nucleolar complex-associated protein 3 n=1 Tax=Trichoderma breve TaxID=2034170 RepID=A0A9W9E7E7_9HYPO|nr:nucleolar complex-associated protein domain-containing protein [Trichoderma breve]KAJ4857376.1 nucleolar complex-associated protein domain-containing protein [Trichoderma breve]